MHTDVDLTVRSRRIVTPRGIRGGVVLVRGGRIVGVGELDDDVRADRMIDAGDRLVMPGLVDTHVHINEPGHTDWEGFATATRAAAAGGITTLVDMPLNSLPVTTSPEAFRLKLEAAAGQLFVDVGFWGGVVPGNLDDLDSLHEAGVLGFKCFLCDSGLPEFPALTDDSLHEAMTRLAGLDAVLLAHAESPAYLDRVDDRTSARSYEHYLRTRPPTAEITAIDMLVRHAEATGCRVHVVHVSTADGPTRVALARARGVDITCETCPHYLTITAAQIMDGDTLAKCAPPIREEMHGEALWRQLRDGHIALIASDHSPCPIIMKCPETGSFVDAWGGISSLQLLLPLVWTDARRRGMTSPDLVRWLAAHPATLAGLGDRKGAIATGYDADIVIWDDHREWTVRGETLQHRHPHTPYEGRRLVGVALTTIVRGTVVFDHGAFAAASGQPLLRGSR